ncbi:hypothetical protein HIM_01278 [Hirsutella minnesotensis 3608]|nr:hypothetical protein HIM_01278 [Hirsutella minnesotensis 3608]
MAAGGFYLRYRDAQLQQVAQAFLSHPDIIRNLFYVLRMLYHALLAVRGRYLVPGPANVSCLRQHWQPRGNGLLIGCGHAFHHLVSRQGYGSRPGARRLTVERGKAAKVCGGALDRLDAASSGLHVVTQRSSVFSQKRRSAAEAILPGLATDSALDIDLVSTRSRQAFLHFDIALSPQSTPHDSHRFDNILDAIGYRYCGFQMLQPRLSLPAACRSLQLLSARGLASRGYATQASRAPGTSGLSSEARLASVESTGPRSSILRTYKPRTPGVRHLRRPINDHLWKGRAFLPLTFPKKGHGKGGRNVHGRITVRHRGGGAKRRIRMVDFERRQPGAHLVERIEYDPGRSAHIALLTNQATKRKSYIIAAEGLRAGDVVHSYRAGIPQDLLKSMGGAVDPGILAAKTAFRGNCLPMHMIPVGTTVFCVGSSPDRGAVFCRSAGTSATVVNKNEETKDDGTRVMTGKYVEVRLQSGEVRRVNKNACATIGVASNQHHHYRQLGKAGRSRWLNIRPTVRGVAMNKVDHPHGGGRGKSKSNRTPVSPWGVPTKSGYKTRRTHNVNSWVVTPRPRNHGKRRDKKS